MLREYFKIIRFALNQTRSKKDGNYYESHHIVPRSFDKKSSTVLLTPQEHYRAHSILAESFKHHAIYGKKMLWAFHRMTYSKKRTLTEQEYVEARLALMILWKRKKSEKHKQNIAISNTNKKWVYNEHTEEYKKIDAEDLELYLKKGWKNTHKFKENWTPTEETRKNMSEAASRSKLGKIGEESRASKGSVICKNKITGLVLEAGSAFQLANKLEEIGLKIGYSVLHEQLNKHNYRRNVKPRTKASKYYQFLQDHEIYYKN
jgi:hypothetical protein